jgi:hypothetical protein
MIVLPGELRFFNAVAQPHSGSSRRMLHKLLAAALAAPWRVGALALVASVVWCTHYDRWTLASWSVPTLYGGDAMEIYTRIAASAEGDAAPFRPQVITRLGAPHGANWNAYPSSDVVLLWLIGRVARVTGVFPAANLALLLACVTSALAFYGCARWLRVRWEWAFATALLFAFTLQSFQRGIAHLFLIYTWTVPAALLVCGLVAHSSRLTFRGWAGGLCLLTGLMIGMGNPYVLFLFLQLLGWALIAQWLGARRRANLVVGGATLAAALVAFAAAEAHLWLFKTDTAALSPLVRNYVGTEFYAMKPVELFLPPPGHRWDLLAGLGFRYLDTSEFRSGESSMSYLGLVAIGGLTWLVLASFRRLLNRQPPPVAAMPAAWVLAFSSLGGLTNLFALVTGLVVFRATNRFSLFISAIALLFLASRLTRWSAPRPAWLTGALAAIVAGIGLWDQLPNAPGREWQAAVAREVEADRTFGRALEEKLPPGSMVFQLPVIEFPEAVPPHQLEDYAYFRPYLATQSLRFSYGALKRRSRSHWQRNLNTMPTKDLVRRLEWYGFSALYFQRRAFADGGERLLGELTKLGRIQQVVDSNNQQVAVLLRPMARPAAPMADRLTFGRGWHGTRPGEPRWAYGPAALSYFNPLPAPVRTRTRFVFTGEGRRTLCIKLNNTEAARTSVTEGRHALEVDLTLKSGVNRIDIESDESPRRSGGGSGSLRTFGVYETAVTVEEPIPGQVD